VFRFTYYFYFSGGLVSRPVDFVLGKILCAAAPRDLRGGANWRIYNSAIVWRAMRTGSG
jgi:hypothetical protein